MHKTLEWYPLSSIADSRQLAADRQARLATLIQCEAALQQIEKNYYHAVKQLASRSMLLVLAMGVSVVSIYKLFNVYRTIYAASNTLFDCLPPLVDNSAFVYDNAPCNLDRRYLASYWNDTQLDACYPAFQLAVSPGCSYQKVLAIIGTVIGIASTLALAINLSFWLSDHCINWHNFNEMADEQLKNLAQHYNLQGNVGFFKISGTRTLINNEKEILEKNLSARIMSEI